MMMSRYLTPEQKNYNKHPAVGGLLYKVYTRNRGAPAVVDYDEEPFRVRVGGETGATKSKPSDDKETARKQTELQDIRNSE